MGKNSKDADRVDAKPNGIVEFVLSGETYTLRRPTVGQLRSFEESLTEVADRTKEADPDKQTAALFDWWRSVFLAVGSKPLTLDDDDLPPWMPTAALIVELRQHWRSVPWGPGGQPTTRMMQEAAAPLTTLLGRQG